MALTELGGKIRDIFKRLNGVESVDRKIFDEVVNNLGLVLYKADVNLKLIQKVQNEIKGKYSSVEEHIGDKKLKVMKLFASELQKMLTPDRKPYEMKRNQTNVVVFVGLQGAGKTTTCAKYASYYKKKGFKVGLVGADTFRAGAVQQLFQNAAKCKIPCYSNYNEMDPVKISVEGVSHFKKQKYEVIIIDTSGRHRQEEHLFDEMSQIMSAVTPDEIVYVIDSLNGQACHDQAASFKKHANIGSVILTKLDSNSKGGGALSAVTATGSPITFIGTGEHFTDFDKFDPEGFISNLLGAGNIKGLIEKVKDAVSVEDQKKLMEALKKGKFSFRDLKNQYLTMLNMGPLDKIVNMLPGMAGNLLPPGSGEQSSKSIKKYLCIMDSMTEIELDMLKPLDQSRVNRIAKGSGSSPQEITEFLNSFKKIKETMENFSKITGGKSMQDFMRNPNNLLGKMSTGLPPDMLSKLGGVGNIANLLKQCPDLASEAEGGKRRSNNKKR